MPRTICGCLLAIATTTLAHASAALCTLKSSGPVVVTKSNTVIELLSITSTMAGQAALTVKGASNVTIRNVQIHHSSGGQGIAFFQSPSITIQNVEIIATGHAGQGPNNCAMANKDCDNIFGSDSPNARIDSVVLNGGSTGIELSFHSHFAHVSRVLATNNRGPFPRGQCVQFTMSDHGLLEDFYCSNDNTSYTEDNINIWRSSNVTVRRGVVDGNNSPTGVGVMFEMSTAGVHGGLIEDVDAIHQGDGCFSGYSSTLLRMTRTRCGWNHCTGWAGRSKPSSNSLMWAAGDEDGIQSKGIVVENSSYYEVCNPGNVHWEASKGGFAGDTVDATESTFTPQSPPKVGLCWQQPLGTII